MLDRCCPSKASSLPSSEEEEEEEQPAQSSIPTVGLESQRGFGFKAHCVTQQCLSADPRTQVSAGEVSLGEISHPSLVVAHGAEEAAKKVAAKPKLSVYAFSPHEVYGTRSTTSQDACLPASKVERYLVGSIQAIVPKKFWGSEANEKLIMSRKAFVSRFELVLMLSRVDLARLVRLRRYETFTVHTIVQGFSVLDCEWLSGPWSSSASLGQTQKPNQLEMKKREELLADFLYWFFDGLVIELLRVSPLVCFASSLQC